MSIQQALDNKVIEEAVNKHNEVVIIKENDNIVVMSMEEYKNKMMKKDIINKLKKSEKEIDKGEGIDSDIAFKELKAKYGY